MDNSMNELYFDDVTAELYDVQYDFDHDVYFYTEEAKAAGGKVLELACGSGRLLIPALKGGADVEGLDYSGDMLKVLKKKLESENLETELHHQSMLDFSIDKKYSLITIPFSSFFILTTQEDQLNCLKNCHAHLEDGGRMILDFFINSIARTRLQDGRITPAKEMEFKGQKITLLESVINDPLAQRKDVVYYYEFWSKTGELEKTLRRKIELRWIYPGEFNLMAKLAGFSKVELFGGFHKQKLVDEKQRLVAVLTK